MFKLRIHLSVIFILCSLVCAVWALQPLTTSQQAGKDKCYNSYNACVSRCTRVYKNIDRNIACDNRCIDTLAGCLGQLGISAPLPPKHTTKVPQGTLTTTALPTASPSGSPKRVAPQGTLTQASPTPTPTAHEKKKKN